MGRAIPPDGVHRCDSRVRRQHWKAPLAKNHHAAADADRADDPAPGTQSNAENACVAARDKTTLSLAHDDLRGGIAAPFVLDRPINRDAFQTYVDRVLTPELVPPDIDRQDSQSPN